MPTSKKFGQYDDEIMSIDDNGNLHVDLLQLAMLISMPINPKNLAKLGNQVIAHIIDSGEFDTSELITKEEAALRKAQPKQIAFPILSSPNARKPKTDGQIRTSQRHPRP